MLGAHAQAAHARRTATGADGVMPADCSCGSLLRQRGHRAVHRQLLAAFGAGLVGVTGAAISHTFARLRGHGLRGGALRRAGLCGLAWGLLAGWQGVCAGAGDLLPGLLRPGPSVGHPLVPRPPRSGSGGHQDHRDGGKDSAFGTAAHDAVAGYCLWRAERREGWLRAGAAANGCVAAHRASARALLRHTHIDVAKHSDAAGALLWAGGVAGACRA